MRTSVRVPCQRELELPTWGGRRAGAGPKPTVPRERPQLPHRSRPELRPYQPIHVTFRMLDHVWNLRSQRSFAVIHGALEAVRSRKDFRVIHFSIQGNHLHLIAESEGNGALANGIRALSIRIARGLNGMMGRRGAVFEDRYHAHVLRTPAEVRNAVRYAVGNFERHAARRGERTSGRWVDPFSSAAAVLPRRGQGVLFAQPVTSEPRTRLLRNAGWAGNAAESREGVRAAAPRREALSWREPPASSRAPGINDERRSHGVRGRPPLDWARGDAGET